MAAAEQMTVIENKKTEADCMNVFLGAIKIIDAAEARKERMRNLQQLIKAKAEVISNMISEHAKELYEELSVAIASIPTGGVQWLEKLMKLNGYHVYYEDANGGQQDNSIQAQIMVISWEIL
jgi:hypothetical protein